MSMKDLAKNVREVHGEAMAMIENLEKVKGREYALTVQNMLLASQAGVLFNTTLTGIDEKNKTILLMIFESLMSQMLNNTWCLADLDDDEINAVCGDADKISCGVDDLLRSAIKIGRAHV